MMFLKNLGFSDEHINILTESLPNRALLALEESEEKVKNNINYLKDLGVSNYVDAFIDFYNMFLLDNQIFIDIFAKYDREDLVIKLEKNVAIMEYL